MVVFFFLSSAGSEPSFQAATVQLAAGQQADTLVQELDPWRGEAGLLVRRLELSTNPVSLNRIINLCVLHI